MPPNDNPKEATDSASESFVREKGYEAGWRTTAPRNGTARGARSAPGGTPWATPRGATCRRLSPAETPKKGAEYGHKHEHRSSGWRRSRRGDHPVWLIGTIFPSVVVPEEVAAAIGIICVFVARLFIKPTA